MTRFETFLLRFPGFRDLVSQRDALAGHCARLEGELAESLGREGALRRELEEAGREAAARERVLRETLRSLRPQPAGIRERMRIDWDDRARAEGLSLIATGRTDWTEGEFFASGEENVRDHILTDMDDICRGNDPKQMRIVEIGCGAGRMTRALAMIFGEVHGVDISPEMIRLAREKLADLPNVRLYVNSGADLSVLPDPPFHFAFSFIVFQHIPDKTIIENYIAEAHRLLETGALFKFQVEGGPATGRSPEDTWHGASFTENELREMGTRRGFEVRYLEGAGTQYFWAWFFRR